MNRLRIKEDINLIEMCEGWTDTGDCYELESPFDEFVSINKENRLIKQYGYHGLINDWLISGIASYR